MQSLAKLIYSEHKYCMEACLETIRWEIKYEKKYELLDKAGYDHCVRICAKPYRFYIAEELEKKANVLSGLKKE